MIRQTLVLVGLYIVADFDISEEFPTILKFFSPATLASIAAGKKTYL